MKRALSVAIPLLGLVFTGGCQSHPSGGGSLDPIENYAQVVFTSYQQAHGDAVKMQGAIDAFLAKPNKTTLAAARHAWLHARDSYGQTEAFRFYGGPIDFADVATGEEGPEARINSWPLNEAWIDAVRGRPTSGIIHDTSVPITVEALVERNAADDEANVTTGYHAIEFLLWGQDFSVDGPGDRPASDFAPGDAVRERRRTYLRVVTDLLVSDLAWLADVWAPTPSDGVKRYYRTTFTSLPRNEELSHILTALATLSAFELSAERIAAPLDSGSQEDEHSCFSDNTHNDYIMNVAGIRNVYLGRVGRLRGAGINSLVAEKDAKLNALIESKIDAALTTARQLDVPIDQTLASPKGSARRQKLETLSTQLRDLGALFVDAGKALGVEVTIASE